MDTILLNKFKRLQSFTKSLSISVELALPNIQQTLNSNRPLLKGCPSREAMALMELGQVEEKLTEVTAAVAAIRKLLYLRHQAKKSRG